MNERDEKVFTRGMKLGFGALGLGLGIMFLSGKVLVPARSGGIALGIFVALVGLILVIWEGIRE